MFLDLSTLEPFPDQWTYLSTVQRLSPREAERLASKVGPVRVGVTVTRLRPVTASQTRPQAPSTIPITVHAAIRIAQSDLTPAMLATLKHAASMPNSAFAERIRRRFSTYGIPRFLTSYDETFGGHLVLPRGLADLVATVAEQADSTIDPTDERSTGTPQNLTATATLRDDQQAAVDALADHDLGVLVAPPGADKTVIACSLR